MESLLTKSLGESLVASGGDGLDFFLSEEGKSVDGVRSYNI